MSYASSSSSAAPSARVPRWASGASTAASSTSPSAAAGKAGGGDSAYVQDFNIVQEAVKSIQQHEADIRREAGLLAGANAVAASRRKVEESIRVANVAAEEARRRLEGLAASTVVGVSPDEQHLRRLTRQKLAENLVRASSSLEASWRAFEEQAAARERQVAGASAELELRGRSPDEEANPAHRQAQAQQQLDDVHQGEVEHHAAMVEEYAEEVTSLQRNITSLQRTMMDLAEHTQAQGEVLDNIEHNMSRAAQDTSSATEQLVQASQAHRRNSKILYCLLALAVVVAAAIVIAAVRKQSHPSS